MTDRVTTAMPAADAAARRLRAVVVVYLLAVVGYEAALRWFWYRSHDYLARLPFARLHRLAEVALADGATFRLALLGLPVLALLLLTHLRARHDAIAAVGLRGWRFWAQLAGGALLGWAAGHVVWLVTLAFAAPPGADLLRAARWTSERQLWAEGEGTSWLVLGLCYALARSTVALGEIPPLASQVSGPRRGVWLAVVLFTVPYLGASLSTPLLVLNALLFAWATALARLRRGTLGWPVGLLGGWTAAAKLTLLGRGGAELARALAQTLPPWLSGGAAGPSGSLVLTALLLAGLGWELRPRARRARAAAPVVVPEAAVDEAVEVEGEVRPEGFEPSTP